MDSRKPVAIADEAIFFSPASVPAAWGAGAWSFGACRGSCIKSPSIAFWMERVVSFTSSRLISLSMDVLSSRAALRNSANVLPTVLPISGSRRGPKTNNPIAARTRSSNPPIDPNIPDLHSPAAARLFPSWERPARGPFLDSPRSP